MLNHRKKGEMQLGGSKDFLQEKEPKTINQENSATWQSQTWQLP